MWILLSTVFVASLLGSLHCVGMCGPFALVAAATPEKRQRAWWPTVAYSVGRLLTYGLVGVLFGTIGLLMNQWTTEQTSSVSQWQQTSTMIAGGLMILVGVIALARQLGWRVALPQVLSPLQRVLQAAHKKTIQLTPVTRALVIGMLTSLMPCGWLYTFAITAAGTGSPLAGGLVMVVFWAGTVPIMAALMLGAGHVGRTFQQRIPVVMASVVILLGIFTMAYRGPADVVRPARVVTGVDALVDQINQVDHAELPCCQVKGAADEPLQ